MEALAVMGKSSVGMAQTPAKNLMLVAQQGMAVILLKGQAMVLLLSAGQRKWLEKVSQDWKAPLPRASQKSARAQSPSVGERAG
jgi:hypothetical protein